jgi:hypothetical protein
LLDETDASYCLPSLQRRSGTMAQGDQYDAIIIGTGADGGMLASLR